MEDVPFVVYAQETQYPECCFINNVRAERNRRALFSSNFNINNYCPALNMFQINTNEIFRSRFFFHKI